MKIGNLLCKGNINLSTANVEKKKLNLWCFCLWGECMSVTIVFSCASPALGLKQTKL